jgi:hypothetical protein
MRLIIAGGREATDFDVRTAVTACHMDGTFSPYSADEVVCGEARGADKAGRKWARMNGIQVESFPADWKQHGNAAGPIRNREMGDYATHLLAVWDGKSRGTPLQQLNL